ncbi:MAG: hypothetical protein QM731_00455 [Chitinophagaceae bacterium]
MRIIGTLLLSFCSLYCLAQDDEFPDTRLNNKRESFSRMQEKDLRSDLSTFTITGIEERMSGKLKPKSIPPIATNYNSMTFSDGDIKVVITEGLFDPAKHKLGYYDNKYLIKIDGKVFYGDYGSMPQKTIASVLVTVGKDTVAIPPTAYSDLYHPVFAYKDGGAMRTHNGVYVSGDKEHTNIYIYMQNSEVKGSYEVTWIIRDKQFVRRVVDTGILK